MIEFKDEEEYCRYNGILCSPENITNEARICKVCLAHESRYINVRYQIATNPKSEYKELLETIKNE